MDYITIPNIEKEIKHILETKQMSRDNLDMFVMLCKAMKYMSYVNNTFTEHDAKMWVRSMDPPARWNMEQTTSVMRQMGYHHEPFAFYAVINALVSDYGKTMAKYGADKAELWAELAHDWLEDKDAEPDKVGRYWRDIVSHD